MAAMKNGKFYFLLKLGQYKIISISFGRNTYEWGILASVKDRIIIGMEFIHYFGAKLNLICYTFMLQGEVLEFNHAKSKLNGILRFVFLLIKS